MADDVDPKDLVTDQDVNALRVLPLALTGGAVAFLLVVVGLSFQGAPPESDLDPGLLQILSLAHAAVFAGALTASLLVPRMLLRRGARDSSLQAVKGRLLAATVIRAVALEGAALFGTVICLLAVLSGYHVEAPAVWLNGLSTVALVVSTVLTLPNRARLVESLRVAMGR